jgi:hypothetical protein
MYGDRRTSLPTAYGNYGSKCLRNRQLVLIHIRSNDAIVEISDLLRISLFERLDPLFGVRLGRNQVLGDTPFRMVPSSIRVRYVVSSTIPFSSSTQIEKLQTRQTKRQTYRTIDLTTSTEDRTIL